MDRVELLVREYETITAQIIHWDSHMWHKSQFFLAIESVLLAVIVQRLSTEFADNTPINFGIFLILVAAALFNLFICYVWFRTNRSNREYLKVRFDRALQIENDPDIKGVVQLYHLQQTILTEPKYAKHSSSRWEIHLPTAFIFAWIASLVAAALDTISLVPAIVVGSTIVLILALILFVEKTGWPNPVRGTVKNRKKQERGLTPAAPDLAIGGDFDCFKPEKVTNGDRHTPDPPGG